MKEETVTWRIFVIYIMLTLLLLLGGRVSAQVVVTEFNAEWNKSNGVKWLGELEDCDITKVDIVKYPKFQKQHKIVVVPTLIIFKDGEEVIMDIIQRLIQLIQTLYIYQIV